jgi:hypothetical protein
MHTNNSSVHNEMAIYFALENIKKKKSIETLSSGVLVVVVVMMMMMMIIVKTKKGDVAVSVGPHLCAEDAKC